MKYHLLSSVLLAAFLLALVGCSNNTPIGPTSESQEFTGQVSTDEPVQFAARVETANQARQMLTFAGLNDTGVASRYCLIVRVNGGEEAPVPFTEMNPWDSVEVNGYRAQNGYVVMNRIRILGGNCYDVAFRATLTAIDYAAGTFTVAGRTETIHVDEGTLIWGNLIDRQAEYSNRYEYNYMSGQAAGSGPGYHYNVYRRDTLLTFSDLEVGDVVEVKADIIDADNLLALAVKLANEPLLAERCTKFEATIATLDVATRTITFVENSWTGVVCPGAILLDPDGNTILLEDFAVGDYVAVKGMEQEDGSLKICLMQKL